MSAVSPLRMPGGVGDSLGIRLLRDLRDAFGDADKLATEVILERLVSASTARTVGLTYAANHSTRAVCQTSSEIRDDT